MSKVFSSCLVACLVATMGSSVQAETIAITNGNFESYASGKFTGWTYTSSKTVASDYTTHPISGSNTAQMITGTSGGYLYQTVSSTGIADVSFRLDFAVLSSAAAVRSFSLILASDTSAATTVDSIRVYSTSSGKYELQIYKGSNWSWVQTGLYVNATTDVNASGVFDGETATVNHLTVVATGEGAAGRKLTLSLTNDAGVTIGSYTYSDTGTSTGTIKSIALFSGFTTSGTSYLVDNVVVPEPSSLALMATGIVSLLAFAWRKRK